MAFIRHGDVLVRVLSRGEARRLTRGGGCSSPRFSASGQWLLADCEAGLQVFRLDNGAARCLGPGSGVWAPNTDRLAFASPSGTWVLAPGNGFARGQRLTRFAATAWSPDEKLLAAAAYRTVGRGLGGEPLRDGLLHVVPALAGGAPKLLLHRYLTGYIPFGWAAGATLLFFVNPDFSASGRADGLELFSIPGTGGNAVSLGFQVLLDRNMLSFSPDRRRLAASAGLGREVFESKRIVVYDFLAKRLAWLTSSQSSAISPAWSRDAAWIAYASGPTARTGDLPLPERRIWIMHPDGAGKRRLSAARGWRDEHPEWTRDGSAVVFCRRRLDGKAGGVWLVPVQPGGPPVRIVDGIDVPEDYYGYAAWDRVMDLSR